MSGIITDNLGRSTGLIKSAGGGGKVLQVVQTVETDDSSMSSATFADIGISADITPTASSSKILVIATLDVGGDGGARGGLRLVRDSTDVLLADAAGSRTRASVTTAPASNAYTVHPNITYLDSPSTTSATTYKLQASIEGSNTIYLNRTETNTDSSDFYRGASTLTLMEIGA